MATGLTGEITLGSYVRTLHFRRAVYGMVTHWIRGNRFVTVAGRTQPGAKLQTFRVHVENLDLVTEDELAPEDRISYRETIGRGQKGGE